MFPVCFFEQSFLPFALRPEPQTGHDTGNCSEGEKERAQERRKKVEEEWRRTGEKEQGRRRSALQQ